MFISNNLLNKLIEVYTSEEIDKFDVGYIKNFDKQWLLLHIYDPYIIDDGIMLVDIDTIWKINYETKYLQPFLNLSIENKEIDITEDLLNNIINSVINKKIVYIVLNNGDTLLGKIIENSDNLIIKNYTDSGQFDGFSTIDKETISVIQYDCRACKNVENILNKKL